MAPSPDGVHPQDRHPPGPPVEPSGAVGAAPPATPDAAARLFGQRLALAERYVALLADTGISHGLVGPRERPRLWERHVLGCAVLTDAIREGSTVIDIGSGAGLPGLVLAIRRPDLQVTLVEPLHRRVVWLEAAVETLRLTNVSVHEGRADSRWAGPRVDVVTARAVARIGVLAGWSLPLLVAGGCLLAVKGSSAQAEVEEDAAALRSAGAVRWQVGQLGVDLIDPPATVVSVWVEDPPGSPLTRRRAGRTRAAKPGSGGSPPPRRAR